MDDADFTFIPEFENLVRKLTQMILLIVFVSRHCEELRGTKQSNPP
jgi:hypothetical protein